jgi:AcrR family transcriptional regulator
VGKRSRAIPLAPEDRRRAIVEAVIPLLIDRGAAVTTREMAEAAGIAEGTIFRVFPDKTALIREAVKVSVDPAPVQAELAQIYPDAQLDVQLAEAARILTERFETVIALIGILATLPHEPSHEHHGPPRFVAEANAAINESLAVIFERHHERLRLKPARAANAFRGLLLAASHPTLAMTERLTIDEVVAVLLEGITEPDRVGVG